MTGIVRHVPNILTGLRLLSAPMLAWLMLDAYNAAAFGIFLFAGISDAADGFLAKRFGFATRFGRYLDPAADKLLMLAAFLSLAALHYAPVWLVALVIFRDVAIVVGVVLANVLNLPLKIEPLPIGKWNTAVQIGYVGLMLLLVLIAQPDPPDPLASFVAAAATGAMTFASGFAYALLWLRAFSQSRRPAA